MHTHSGFSLIEVLVTMTFVAILTSISVSSFSNARVQTLFAVDVREVFETILEARTNALSNKNCVNGSGVSKVSAEWHVNLSQTTADASVNLVCKDTSGTSYVVRTTDLKPFTDINTVYFPETSSSNSASRVVKIFFISGRFQSRVRDINSVDSDSVKIIFENESNRKNQTLCFHRVGGFPRLNKDGNTCTQ